MEYTIKASLRDKFGKQNKKLRLQGFLPAVVYGQGKQNLDLAVSGKEFEKIFAGAGESSLVNLDIEGQEKKKVLIHDVAKHFMKDEPIHVDFYEVDLTRKIHAKIPLHFVEISPAVKELGGIMVKSISEVEVEALPSDLPPFIEADVSKLKTFDDLIHLRDLKVSDKVKILGHAEEAVATVQAPKTEEELRAELATPVAEVEKAAIETMEKKAEEVKAKKEGEEKAEEVPAKKAET